MLQFTRAIILIAKRNKILIGSSVLFIMKIYIFKLNYQILFLEANSRPYTEIFILKVYMKKKIKLKNIKR